MQGESREIKMVPGEGYIRREDLRQFEEQSRQSWKAVLVLISMIARTKSRTLQSEGADEGKQHPLTAAAKVLLIGIDPASSRELTAMLATGGFDVVSCQSAAEGFLRVKGANMVILDEELPNIAEAFKHIHERFRMPIILLGSRVDPQAWDNAVAMGADAYLKRVMSRQELVARIRAILRRYRTVRHSVGGEDHE